MVKQFSALDKSAFTFNVWDVYVELGEFLTRALHALVHWLQNLFGVLLHPSVTSQQTGCATRFETEGTSFQGFSADLISHPSLGKLCLISTWWWLRSSAVFELNTFKQRNTKLYSSFCWGRLSKDTAFNKRPELTFTSNCNWLQI